MNTPINKETYILDDSIAFELMDLLKAKARHFIQLNEYVYRLFDGQSVVTGDPVPIEAKGKQPT
ncbi:MAG: DUF1655 domain-containing protein, partial [Lactococcus lactis]|nr:DUF1655 domain-containing protein [Lactococcus lactis]